MCTDCGGARDPGSDEIGFEEIYARAGPDFAAIPWAALAPHPALVQWLDRQPPTPGHVGHAVLVIGCGLGDDAEEASRRGYRVTAFDLSPTAINRCRQRFPGSAVDYQVADLLALPGRWNSVFDLVVEIRTLQSLPSSQRAQAASGIAWTVRPGGQVFVRCLARDDDEPQTSRPWPLSRRELQAFTDAGLHQVELLDQPAGPGRGRSFTAVYVRT